MTVVEATLKIKDVGAAKILKFGSLFRAFVFDLLIDLMICFTFCILKFWDEHALVKKFSDL